MGKKIKLISPVIDYDMYNKVIKNNKFTKNFELLDIDNRKENNFISKCYNTFLNSYDYSKDSWFVFCHEDFEFLDDVENKILNLSKNYIYGPVGIDINFIDTKKKEVQVQYKGKYKDKNKAGLCYRSIVFKNYKDGDVVQSLDCMCVIINSSLIKKYKLRFDEELTWNLYVEDFCVNSRIKHGIKARLIEIECCHWSQLDDINERKSFFKDLEYLNFIKFKYHIFIGTCGLFGGKSLGFKTKVVDSKISFLKNLKYKIILYVQKLCL